jgi:regulator of sigma E protease
MLITTLLVFFLILSVLVLIHELGHFTAAKKMGIKVEEFGFGLPPMIWGKKIGETMYSINWLPIGGFVKLYGEDREEDSSKAGNLRLRSGRAGNKKDKDAARAFYAKPIWQRVVVLVAGVSMNFVLGVAIISYLFTQGVMVPTQRVHIENVLPGSPAVSAGLEKGDIVKQIIIKDGNATPKEFPIIKSEDISKITKSHLGEEITLVIVRENTEKGISIVPRKDYPSKEGPMGIVISNYEEKKYPIYSAPFYGTKEAMVLSVELVKGIGMTIWKLISFQPVSKDVAGPIGIAELTGEAVKFGRMAVLELLGILSLNLAIVNILPFPALDGGRLMFILVEAVTGKKVKATWERYIHQAGMIVLLTLILLVTINDLVRIFTR